MKFSGDVRIPRNAKANMDRVRNRAVAYPDDVKSKSMPVRLIDESGDEVDTDNVPRAGAEELRHLVIPELNGIAKIDSDDRINRFVDKEAKGAVEVDSWKW